MERKSEDDKKKEESKMKEEESTSKEIGNDTDDKEKGIEIEKHKDKPREKEIGINLEKSEVKDKEIIKDTELRVIKTESDKAKHPENAKLLANMAGKEKATSTKGKKSRERGRLHNETAHAGNLPILTPPKIKSKWSSIWYRHASDVAQVGSKYADEEEDKDPEIPRDVSQLGPRPQWGNQVEFLMSCIATSVGLGNVWRFAFVAYENGGGAFLIPYLVVLVLVGKPMYFLECLIGQFSSRNNVRIWSMSPGLRGTGYAQCVCTFYVMSYYVAIIALCLYYLVVSFITPLPWTYCRPSWANCLPSDPSLQTKNVSSEDFSSAELYFINVVIQQSSGLEGGLGSPLWYLTVCLLVCWIVIFIIVIQGVKSTGKASYFLAIFPYVIMFLLLATTVTLPGAFKGILFFITPDWKKVTELGVWYAAVTQVFFSLGVGVGPIIMYSSYNDFNSKVFRDSSIVTTLDTLTSLLSGFTIFGILGNLAYVLNTNVGDVVGSGGTGLAFISYPDALAKTLYPHVFAILFFLMMTVLGFGSAVAFFSTINTVLLDAFPNLSTLYITLVSCFVGFCSGLVYITPEGQYILTLVDYFGGTFLALFGCIAEIIGIAWVYGLENFCLDMEYMIDMKASIYWRCCWGLITPVLMIVVFSYALLNSGGLVYSGEYSYPPLASLSGYVLLFIGMLFVPIYIIKTYLHKWTGNFSETSHLVFKAKQTWGPRSTEERENWKEFKKEALIHQKGFQVSKLRHYCLILTGGYRKGI